jgi:hypothetical protein
VAQEVGDAGLLRSILGHDLYFLYLVLDEVEPAQGQDLVLELVQLPEDIAGAPALLGVFLQHLIENGAEVSAVRHG